MQGPRWHIEDGAIATQLAQRGFELNAPSFAIDANEKAPDLVRDLYLDYAKAGAQTLTLNSFGLSQGLDLRQDFALRARAQAAMRLCLPGHEPLGALSLAPASAGVCPCDRLVAEARALAGAGVTQLRVETLMFGEDFACHASTLRHELSALSLRVHLSFCDGIGAPLFALLERSGWLGPKSPLQSLGLNCQDLERSAQDAMILARLMQAPRHAKFAGSLALSVRPHLSAPSPHGWVTHAHGAQAFADWGAKLCHTLDSVWTGPLHMGACCGSSPSHIAALHQRLGATNT